MWTKVLLLLTPSSSFTHHNLPESTFLAISFCRQQWPTSTSCGLSRATLCLSAWKALLSHHQANKPFPSSPSLPSSHVYASLTDIYHTAPRLSIFLSLSLDCEHLEDRDCVWFIYNLRGQCRALGFVGRINEYMDGSLGAHLLSIVKSALLALYPTTLLSSQTSLISLSPLQNQFKNRSTFIF